MMKRFANPQLDGKAFRLINKTYSKQRAAITIDNKVIQYQLIKGGV